MQKPDIHPTVIAAQRSRYEPAWVARLDSFMTFLAGVLIGCLAMGVHP